MYPAARSTPFLHPRRTLRSPTLINSRHALGIARVEGTRAHTCVLLRADVSSLNELVSVRPHIGTFKINLRVRLLSSPSAHRDARIHSARPTAV